VYLFTEKPNNNRLIESKYAKSSNNPLEDEIEKEISSAPLESIFIDTDLMARVATAQNYQHQPASKGQI